MKTQREDGHLICEPRGGLSPDTKAASPVILDSPASTTVKNKCLLFKPPAYGYFLFHSLYGLGHQPSSPRILRRTPRFHLGSASRRSYLGVGGDTRCLFPQGPPSWQGSYSCLISVPFNYTSLSLPLDSRTIPRPHPFRCG